MEIAESKYVALTTYRKNGESSSTPVWIADLGDGTIGFTTPGTSLKARRLANDNRVLLQPSDGRGRPREGSTVMAGSAVVLGGDDFDRVRSKIKAKYGWQVGMAAFMGKVAKLFGKDRISDTAVVISLD